MRIVDFELENWTLNQSENQIIEWELPNTSNDLMGGHVVLWINGLVEGMPIQWKISLKISPIILA